MRCEAPRNSRILRPRRGRIVYPLHDGPSVREHRQLHPRLLAGAVVFDSVTDFGLRYRQFPRARNGRMLQALEAFPRATFVLDGEAMGWLDDERPGVFQETMSSFGRRDGVAGASLGARFFDVLHVDEARDDLDPRPGLSLLPALAWPVGQASAGRLPTEPGPLAAAFTATFAFSISSVPVSRV